MRTYSVAISKFLSNFLIDVVRWLCLPFFFFFFSLIVNVLDDGCSNGKRDKFRSANEKINKRQSFENECDTKWKLHRIFSRIYDVQWKRTYLFFEKYLIFLYFKSIQWCLKIKTLECTNSKVFRNVQLWFLLHVSVNKVHKFMDKYPNITKLFWFEFSVDG